MREESSIAPEGPDIPNHADLPHWTAYETTHDATMSSTLNAKVVNDPGKGKRLALASGVTTQDAIVVDPSDSLESGASVQIADATRKGATK